MHACWEAILAAKSKKFKRAVRITQDEYRLLQKAYAHRGAHGYQMDFVGDVLAEWLKKYARVDVASIEPPAPVGGGDPSRSVEVRAPDALMRDADRIVAFAKGEGAGPQSFAAVVRLAIKAAGEGTEGTGPRDR